MASTAGANVVIKLDIKGDKNVKNRLDLMAKRFEALDKSSGSYGKSIDNMAKSHTKLNTSLKDTRTHLDDLNRNKFPALQRRVEGLNPHLRDMKGHFSGISRSSGTMNKHLKESNDELVKMGGIAKSLRNNHLIPLDKELKQKKKDFEALNKEVDKSTRTMKTYEKQVDRTRRSSRGGGGDGEGIFGKMFGRTLKFMKIFGIEFGVMTAAVGAFRGALWLGQQATQLWSSALQGLGAAAGVAVAALAGVLAAQRELARAQMGPLFELAGQKKTGQYNISSLMSGVLDSEQYAMFDQAALMQSMRTAQRAKVSNNDLRGILDTVGNFAIVADNPKKALTGLSDAFIAASKEGGKFSKDTFETIAEESPEMAKGFEEIYGGADKLKSALASGKVTVADFTKALNEGTLESLAPFKGALDEVNNTLIGQFKGTLTDVKGKLTELGAPLVELAKGPLAQLKEELGLFLFKIGPTIQKTMAAIFGGGESIGMQRMFDKLANLINSGMPKLVGLGGRLRDMFRDMGKWFGKLGGWLETASSSWDGIFENILKPLGTEVWKTIEHAIKSFNDVMGDSEGYSKNFGDRLHDIFEGVRNLIDGFSNMKRVLAPVIDSFTRMLTILSKILNIPGLSTLAAFGIMGGILGKGGKGGKGGGKVGMMGGIASMFMMPFGGFGMGGKRGGGSGGSGRFNSSFEAYKSSYLVDQRPSRFQSARWAMRDYVKGQTWDPVDSYSGYRHQSQRVDPKKVNRFQAARWAARDNKTFWAQGAKTFVKGAMPALGGIALSYAGGLISGNAKSTNKTAQSWGGALSGAGQGAMMGAAVGSMVPVIGTAVGAAVGGVIGGISGFITGGDAAEKAQAEERQALIDKTRESSFAGLRANDLVGLLARMGTIQQSIQDLESFGTNYYGLKTDEIDPDNLMSNLDQTLISPIVDRWIQGTTTAADEQIAAIMTRGSKEIEERVGKKKGGYSVEDWMGTSGTALSTTALGKDDISARLDMLNELNNTQGLLDSQQKGFVEAQIDANEYMLRMHEQNPGLTPENAAIMHDQRIKDFTEMKRQALTTSANMQVLSESMGITNGEALKLADSAGLVLNDKLLTLGQVLATLGYSADTASNRINAATKILRDAFTGAEGRRNQTALYEEYNRTGQYFADTNWEGNPEGAQAASDDYVQAWMAKQLKQLETGDLTYRDFIRETKESIAAQMEVLGGPGTVQGAAFKKTTDEVLANIGNASDFSTRLQYDPDFGVRLNKRLIEIITEKRNTDGMTQEQGIAETKTEIESYLKGQGIDPSTITDSLQTLIASEYQNQLDLYGQALQGLEDVLKNINITLDGTLALTSEAEEILGSLNVTTTPKGDTTSERLSRTLSKHASITSSIPGNRTITSSFRTDNLGSMMSDHATGNAYDLTGQNLGQYADSVNGAGGFAEFHGSAGGRHLHVVPPQGDSANPASVGGGGGGVVINAPITVNARDGESAHKIARIVMDELAARERSARERV